MTQIRETISVVICTYTERRWSNLLTAVASVQRQTQPALEIIVVIDYNISLLQQARKQMLDVRIIENRETKGLSGARNSGAALAQGSIVAYLDDDAIADPHWIEQLIICYTHPHVVGVGGKIEPLWPGTRPSWFPEEFDWVVGCTYRGMPAQQAIVRNVIGANMSIRRQILMDAGGFRTSLGWNCDNTSTSHRSTSRKKINFWNVRYYDVGDEETEICLRIAHHAPNSEWIYTPHAIVQHYVSLQHTRWSYFLWRCYVEGLGKAQLVKLHGLHNGLSSERAYIYKTLPQGVVRYVARALRRQNATCLMGAGSIISGLLTTLTGYTIGTVVRLFVRTE